MKNSLGAAPTVSAGRASVCSAASAGRTAPAGKWQRVWSLVAGVHALALVDQVVVSAASFATTVTIGRYTDASQLGAYAIAISVLASAFTIQGSLITLPYSIQQHSPTGTPQEHAGSSLALSSMLAALISIGLAVAALGLLAAGAESEMTAMTWAIAAVMPFALGREFCRRFSFTHLQMVHALALDGAAAAAQISMLALLAWTGHLTAVTACGAIGASCGLAAAGWWYLARTRFAFRAGDVRATVNQSWSLGKWLFANQIMVQVQRYATYWLSAVIAGAAVTGVFAACMSIVAFANPVTFGLGNILAPRSVLAWKERGGSGLRRQAIGDALLLVVVMAAFCAAVIVVGEDVMRLLYHGKEYEGHAHTIAVLALATLASAVGMPASNALAAMERPYAIALVGAAGAVTTVILVWGLMAEWGLVGAAYGLLSGNVVWSLGLWIGFLATVPRTYDSTPVVQVMQMLTGTSDPEPWRITRLGEGDHANVYAVQSRKPEPIWRTHQDLVIKLYKPEAVTPELVEAQFAALSRLHSAIDGLTANGWTFSAPRPLHISKSPLALVMTAVSGNKDLRSSAASDHDLTAEMLEAVARAFVAGMKESWSRGRLHGDLALQNILYDIDAKTLSLIDPGTQECCLVCNDSTTRWRPAVRELGHILRDLGTDVRDIVGNPVARFRRQIFVRSALQAYIETIDQIDDKNRALDEIRACAQAHLGKVIEPGQSPRGLWNWVLTQFVIRRMDAVIEEITPALAVVASAAISDDRGFRQEADRHVRDHEHA